MLCDQGVEPTEQISCCWEITQQDRQLAIGQSHDLGDQKVKKTHPHADLTGT